jgi:hypothetical protein
VLLTAAQVALREELARMQEIASKLDAMYKLAEGEAAQYRVQFKVQEDDRQHLVRWATAAVWLHWPEADAASVLLYEVLSPARSASSVDGTCV